MSITGELDAQCRGSGRGSETSSRLVGGGGQGLRRSAVGVGGGARGQRIVCHVSLWVRG